MTNANLGTNNMQIKVEVLLTINPVGQLDTEVVRQARLTGISECIQTALEQEFGDKLETLLINGEIVRR